MPGTYPVPPGEKQTHNVITNYFIEEDVGPIFTFLSGGIQHLLSDIAERSEIPLVHTRHEQNAVLMADGYYRATGDIGVCIVGRGPGLAQMGTGMLTAQRNQSKVLLLVPDSAMSLYHTDWYERHDIKRWDHQTFLEKTMSEVISIESHDTVIPELKESFRQLKIGNGPVAVRIPEDIISTEIDPSIEVGPDDFVPDDPYGISNADLNPDPGSISKALDIYLDSDATKAPVILAGIGAAKSGAEDAVAELAERMNAFIVTTMQGRGFMSDHPFTLGLTGNKGRNLANEYLYEADFILAVGCSLNVMTTSLGRNINEDAKIVHIDNNANSIDLYTEVDHGIVGDARTTVRAFEEELARNDIDRSGEFWTDEMRTKNAETPPYADDNREFPGGSDTIDPRELMLRLEELLPEDRLVVLDGGQNNNWVIEGLSVSHPDNFIWTMDFYSTGLAMPVGIGSSLGLDDKPVIAFAGDVGFMLSIQELETAARYEVPIVVFVMNNNAWGVEYNLLKKANDYADYAKCPAPDFEDVAKAFGADGYTVRSLSDLAEIEDIISEGPDGPVVVDCKTNLDFPPQEFYFP